MMPALVVPAVHLSAAPPHHALRIPQLINRAAICYRQSGSFQAQSATAVEDDRLLTAVYALMRAGCEDDAMELCAKSACAWRSAAMSACGWGLFPVGRDAAPAQKLLSERVRQSAIAADVLSLHRDGAAMALSLIHI